MPNLYRIDGWVKLVSGQAVAGAQVYVCAPQPTDTSYIPPEPLASAWSDPQGVSPITFPIFTDGFGHYDAYLLPGVYTLVIVNNGSVQAVYTDQSVGNIGSGGAPPSTVTSVFGRTGDILAQSGDYSAFYAPIDSPGFTGVPTAPTAPLATNTNQIATTAFVLANSGGGGGILLETNGVANSSQTMLNLAAGTNITLSNVAGTTTINAASAPVTSVFGRTAAVTAQSGDYSVAQVTGAAPLASPSFSGTIQIVNSYITGTFADGTNSVGTSGQVLSSTGTATAWVTSSAGAMVFIAEQILGSPAATVTFSSIPATYRTLKLIITTRCDNSSTDVYIQFNGDTGANYSQVTVYGNASSPAGCNAAFNSALVAFTEVASSSAPANNADPSEITFPHYTNTTWNKTALSQTVRFDTSGSGYLLIFGNMWNNTAAINQILLGVSPSGNFVAGSIFTLYGIS